jgi:hypothetical protein
MSGPRVPGRRDETIALPCSEEVDVHELDMGLREFACDCGGTHAVVMDVHPLARFVPEFLVETLEATVEPADDYDRFRTAHVMGLVMEEFPEAVATADVSEDGSVGYALVWVTDFDARRLHEIVVELLVELMDHAVGHADDEAVVGEFQSHLREFDVEAFVEEYRRERDLESERDSAI